MIKLTPENRGTFNVWRLCELAKRTTRAKGQLELFEHPTELQNAMEQLRSTNPAQPEKTRHC